MSNRELKLLLAFLSFAVCCMFYVVYNNEPIFNDNNNYNKVSSLLKENDSLKKEIALERFKISQYEIIVDSLQNLKPQIIYKYVQKNKSIDNANITDIVNDFKGVFTKANVK